jgi:hypothetical protein
MATLRVFDAQGMLGFIKLEDGQLTGTTKGMQQMADSALRKAGGDPEEAFRGLNGWSNGYVWVRP